jgi:hypothetical protein
MNNLRKFDDRITEENLLKNVDFVVFNTIFDQLDREYIKK